MKVLIVSNMYPDNKYPSYGVFVKRFCDELDILNIQYDKSVMLKANNKISKIFNYLSFYFKSFGRCLIKKYDVVYIHYASHSAAPILLVNKLKKLNIYTNVHGSDVVPENSSQEKMQKYTCRILKLSSKVIVPSEYFKKLVRNKYGIDENNIYIYPSGGIDSKVFNQYSAEKILELKEKYIINNGLPTYGFAGRITENKGWRTFVEAINMAVNNGTKANYVIVGDGPDNDKLEEVINSYGLNKAITRLGFLNHTELAEFYNAIDCLVFPTKGESLGLVALEAMACGTPVIATDITAPSYYIEHLKNGMKFRIGNEMDLFDCIVRFTDFYKQDKVTDYIINAKNTASLYYSDNVRKELEKIFKR